MLLWVHWAALSRSTVFEPYFEIRVFYVRKQKITISKMQMTVYQFS